MEFENTQFIEAAAAASATTSIAKDIPVAEHMQSGSGRLSSNGNDATTAQSASNTTLENKQNPPKMQKEAMSADERKATKRSLVILAAIFTASIFAMAYVYMIFPELNE